MHTPSQRWTVIPAIAAAALLATSCADSSESGETGSGTAAAEEGGTIAFLMPDLASTRYEEQDRPLFEAAVQEQCPGYEVVYANADADAAQQQQQANSALAQGATVIVLDPVDSAAAASTVQAAQAQDVAVIAYDRPIPALPADYYVSFDNEAIGASIARSLLDHLEETGAEGGVLQVNGSPTDAAAGLIRDGVSSVLDPSDYEVLAEFDTPGWQPPDAQRWVGGQINQHRGNIAGVVAANDGTGGASIAAFKSAGIEPVPPITGNDAELAAIQRIVEGSQFNTISKPISIVAEAAAEVACAFAAGNPPEGESTLFDTPSQLFEPTVVTRENLKEVIVDGGIYTAEQICTPAYAAGCTELGIA
ncbi:MAG: Various polyols ABC transporter, substrate-binding protein [uncultured Nocardioidaceae bacterium]|uniref:Various polyols ABC transporter, substrate-binding protein n=1 Tax=uncultured Nocardioidaceae bacterium TaxID=253824 RepID=A0A6J4KWL5_9ACTN|nr:MAG: Various polyols ABC transporter, substrate-binding protein [uncultured Nocardioidaceae bacterium]